MAQRSKGIRPLIKYEVVDIFNMKDLEGKFDIIVDKGLLDAVYSIDNEENKLKIANLLSDFDKILSKNENSRYICISLLQNHILNILLDFFG